MITIPQNVYDVLVAAALGYTISGTVDVDTINHEFGRADGTHDRDYRFFWNGEYSIENITIKDGKAVRDAEQLQTGDDIETRLANGTIHTTVK